MDEFSSRKTGYPHDSADVKPGSPGTGRGEGGGGHVTQPTSPASGVVPASSLLEEQRCEVDQVVAPDHPGVAARRFDDRDRNLLLLQPTGEGAVRRNEVIVRAAGDPQQLQPVLLLHLG